MSDIPRRFTALEVEKIINKVVPLIAHEDDHEFFKGILHVVASESTSSTDFTVFIQSLLSNN